MKKLTQTLIVGLVLCMPVQAQAAITSLETVAGLATEVTVTDLPARTNTLLTVHSPEGDTISLTLSSDASGTVTTWIAGSELQTAGTYRITAEADGSVMNGSLTVHPDTLDTHISFIDAQTNAIEVGEEITVTAVLADRFGNPLSGRSAELISSRSSDYIEALTRETNTYGEQDFVVRAASDGSMTLRAIDLISGQTIQDELHITAGAGFAPVGGPETVAYTAPSTRTQSQFYKPNPYAANTLGGSLRAQAAEAPRFDGIQIQIVGQENAQMPVLEQYQAESMLLTAVDQYGNPYYDFMGTVELATTDPSATLPLFGVYDFRFEDEGSKMLTLGLEFATPGNHQMIIYDPNDGIPQDPRNALGYLEVTVNQEQIVKPPSKPVIISTPRQGGLLSATEVQVQGTGPAFINITIEGGAETITGETDRQGGYSLNVPLDETQTEHTLTVFDSDAPENSAEVTFSIDITPPEISAITFTPENPVEGTDVLVVVDAEPGSQNVTLTINDETHELMSTDPSTGKFQKLLTAPEAAVYDVTVSATDAQGNLAEQTTQLPVALRGLPSVQNVIAEAQINAIALRWDPITNGDVDAYRIYVGTSPDEFLYTLDTDRPTAAATVAGLRPGTTYYFAVTALQGPRESEDKGEIASATVLGVTLDVTPGDGSLFIEWSSLQQDQPLSNFLLEYGVEAGQLTEERLLNGELRAYTLRDLVNGVTYYLKLTPITTTGEKLEDLAADGQGTPIGGGFTAGVSDPVPFDLRGSAPPTPRPPTETPLSNQGLPAWMLISVLAASVVLYQIYVRRQKNKQMTVAFLQAMESRYHQ